MSADDPCRAVPVNLKTEDKFHLTIEEYLHAIVTLVDELVIPSPPPPLLSRQGLFYLMVRSRLALRPMLSLSATSFAHR